jgi:hypothetical protein
MRDEDWTAIHDARTASVKAAVERERENADAKTKLLKVPRLTSTKSAARDRKIYSASKSGTTYDELSQSFGLAG